MICSKCQRETGPGDHFSYTQNGVKKLFSKCKKCHNLGCYERKPVGWAKVADDQKERIQNMIEAGKSIAEIARVESIPYGRLYSWVNRAGDLVLAKMRLNNEIN